MLAECLRVFEEELRKKGDRLILDSYIPANGTYLIVSREGELSEPIVIKMERKSHTIDKSHMLFRDICFYDYSSRLVDMNKPVDPKKIIQSNNYLSFAVKKENILSGKLTSELITAYYDLLLHPETKYQKSKQSDAIYGQFREEYGDVDAGKLERCRQFVLETIFKLEERGINLSEKDYLKIFFEEDESLYQKERERYLLPNLYNSNEYNVELPDGSISGLPNDNLGMNSKKPFLAVKTRKTAAPCLLPRDGALLQGKFFDYLMNFAAAGKYNVFVNQNKNRFEAYENGRMPEEDLSGFFLRIRKGKNEAEIIYQDYIPFFRCRLKKKFVFRNLLGAEHKFHEDWQEAYQEYANTFELERLIDDILFSKCLLNNYFTPAGDLSINDGYLKESIITSRDAVFNFLYKEITNGMSTLADRMTMEQVQGSISEGYLDKAVRQFNFGWSLLEYLEGGSDMGATISEIKNVLWEKINAEETGNIESPEEFYFAAGQIVHYLLSLSKAGKIPQSLANPFFNAKNMEELKEKINRMYLKYNYAIETVEWKYRRFNNMLSMVESYTSEQEGQKVKQVMLIAGFLCNSLVYVKKEEE